MKNEIGIVDLFSGPGGLGEGFSAYVDSQRGCHPFSVEVSVEKDRAAHSTLRLRSFLRKFEQRYPPEYYDFLNGLIDEPDWASLYPEHWASAENECLCMELGQPETAEVLSERIANIRARYGDQTVLIGGPPCQAYSLAGRSRNAGIAEYVPDRDERNFLYQEYVNVLRKLRPALFVMENVKGMLSSAIKGDGIFQRVMSDLKSATGPESYRLVALSPRNDAPPVWFDPEPADFVVRMEEHGIPQARHRVIIVGVHHELADQIPDEFIPKLVKRARGVNVLDVIGAMPVLRSGLSRDDGLAQWKETVQGHCRAIAANPPAGLSESERNEFLSILQAFGETVRGNLKLERRAGTGNTMPATCPEDLHNRIYDPELERLPNNETRGHMPSDLGRYLFAAAFGKAVGRSPKASEFPDILAPEHKNWGSGKFADRFRVQVGTRPASTVTSHISKDGHYFIHPDPMQCRSLTVREAARLQTFPDNYYFKGNRTQQYVQVGNAVPPFLAFQIAEAVWAMLSHKNPKERKPRKPRYNRDNKGFYNFF